MSVNLKIKSIAILLVCLFVSGCASTNRHLASKDELDARIRESITEFYDYTSAGKSLAQKASGMLVFPTVVKGGVVVGGEYGEGALVINGRIADYYNLAGASVGFQAGVQVKSQIILFMNANTLSDFRKSSGWQAGVDGSVAIATLGAGGEISTETAQKPIIGFIYSNKGLMYNLTLEGAKITRIEMVR